MCFYFFRLKPQAVLLPLELLDEIIAKWTCLHLLYRPPMVRGRDKWSSQRLPQLLEDGIMELEDTRPTVSWKHASEARKKVGSYCWRFSIYIYIYYTYIIVAKIREKKFNLRKPLPNCLTERLKNRENNINCTIFLLLAQLKFRIL